MKMLFATLVVCFISGCSGGASLSISAGGSLHDPKHPDLANVVRATPTIDTATSRSWELPKLRSK